MENLEITNWLKESIPGIIILGALGSAACIAAFKILQYLIIKWMPASIDKYNKWKGKRARSFGKTLKYFHTNKHIPGLVSFIAFKALRSVIYAVISASALIIFIILFGGEPTKLTFGNYIILIVSMITAIVSYTEYREVRMMYRAFEKEANKPLQPTADASAE